jgi:hypothetical protein
MIFSDDAIAACGSTLHACDLPAIADAAAACIDSAGRPSLIKANP